MPPSHTPQKLGRPRGLVGWRLGAEERHVDLDTRSSRGFEAPHACDAVLVRVRAGGTVAEGERTRTVRVRPYLFSGKIAFKRSRSRFRGSSSAGHDAQTSQNV